MMARDHPVAGAGAGQFSRRWGTDRNIVYLYVLQPHSLELEIFGELGAVGVALFAVLLVCSFGSTASGVSGRRRSAMAAAVLTALLAEVTVDWTWSFPAVVVPALLVVGAAGGGARLRRPRVTAGVTVPVVAVAAVALALPFLSDRQLDRGRAVAAKNPNEAWDLSRAAQTLNPWDDRIYAFQGRLAGNAGLTALVVKKFDRSAELARQPWQRYFQEAGSLDPKKTKAVRRACVLARNADPLEPNIRYGPCNRVR